MGSERSEQRVFHSAREVCEAYWPKAYAEKRCGCFKTAEDKRGVLVILPRYYLCGGNWTRG